MPDNYECIEPEKQGNTSNAPPHPFENYSSDLRLEMQEELDFQNRLEKETQLILEIKKIAQAKLDYYRLMRQEIKTVDEWIKIFIDYDDYLRRPKAIQDQIKAQVQLGLKTHTKTYEAFLERVLKKIEAKPFNLIEILYLEVCGADSDARQGCTAAYNKEQNILQITSRMKDMISPFLTQEFFCFLSKIQNTPAFSKELNRMSVKEATVEDKIYRNVDIQMMKEVNNLGEALFKRAKKNNLFDNPDIEKALNKIYKESQEVCNIVFERHKKMENELEAAKRARLIQGTQKITFIDVTELSYWADMRLNFSLAYNLARQIEEMNLFIDEWLAKKKIKPQATDSQSLQKLECVETVPKLTDDWLGLERADNSSENIEDTEDTQAQVEAFFEFKQEQLLLWRKVIKYRQQQKAEKENIQRAQLEKKLAPPSMKDIIDIPRAQQLCNVYHNLDEDDIQLYNSLFKPDASCKPHNVRFKNIEKLIQKLSGSLQNNSGSSHFPVYLPDTHYVWEVDRSQSNSMSYLYIPSATGGSYKPHNTSEEWTLAAHLLLKNAFIKAGLTPERFAMAAQLLTVETQVQNKNEIKIN